MKKCDILRINWCCLYVEWGNSGSFIFCIGTLHWKCGLSCFSYLSKKKKMWTLMFFLFGLGELCGIVDHLILHSDIALKMWTCVFLVCVR
jgi:hypothetical protein